MIGPLRQPRKPRRRVVRAVRWTAETTSLVLTATLLLVMIVLGVIQVLPSFTTFVVTSGSMEPELPVGSLILVREVPAGRVRAGDVLTFHLPDARRAVTHRVIERDYVRGQWRFRTSGDANPSLDTWPHDAGARQPSEPGGALTTPDGWITYGSQPAHRLVVHAPQLGSATQAVGMPLVRTAFALVLALLISWRVLRAIWKPSRSAAPPTSVWSGGS